MVAELHVFLRLPAKATSAAPYRAVVSHDQDAGLVSLRDQTCAATRAGTAQHRRHVAVYGVLADVQFFRYLLIGVSVGCGTQDFDFTQC